VKKINSTSSRQTQNTQSQQKNKITQTEQSLNEVNKPYLINLMSFMDGVNYASDREFTNEDLAHITPETIV